MHRLEALQCRLMGEGGKREGCGNCGQQQNKKSRKHDGLFSNALLPNSRTAPAKSSRGCRRGVTKWDDGSDVARFFDAVFRFKKSTSLNTPTVNRNTKK